MHRQVDTTFVLLGAAKSHPSTLAEDYFAVGVGCGFFPARVDRFIYMYATCGLYLSIERRLQLLCDSIRGSTSTWVPRHQCRYAVACDDCLTRVCTELERPALFELYLLIHLLVFGFIISKLSSQLLLFVFGEWFYRTRWKYLNSSPSRKGFRSHSSCDTRREGRFRHPSAKKRKKVARKEQFWRNGAARGKSWPSIREKEDGRPR